MTNASPFQIRACEIAEKIIAAYLEHYSFPWQGESHMHDCITTEVEKILSEPRNYAVLPICTEIRVDSDMVINGQLVKAGTVWRTT